MQYGYWGWDALLVESRNMFSFAAVPEAMRLSVMVSMSRALEYQGMATGLNLHASYLHTI